MANPEIVSISYNTAQEAEEKYANLHERLSVDGNLRYFYMATMLK